MCFGRTSLWEIGNVFEVFSYLDLDMTAKGFFLQCEILFSD